MNRSLTRRATVQSAKLPGTIVVPEVRQSPRRTKAGKVGEFLSLIAAARQRAYQAVNTELVGPYWEVGGYISRKIAGAERGGGVVDELAATITGEYRNREIVYFLGRLLEQSTRCSATTCASNK